MMALIVRDVTATNLLVQEDTGVRCKIWIASGPP